MRNVPNVPNVPTGGSAPDVELADAAAPLVAAARRAVHDLRVETERWYAGRPAWARHWRWSEPALRRPLGARALGAAPDPATESLAALLAPLRAVTTRYVYGLRAAGARPEQMLVGVKALVRDAIAAEGWADPDAAQALTAEVVRWSIAAYYDG